MILTLLDTVTGEKKTIETPSDADWWTFGNGSCDCNRIGHFTDADTGEHCIGCLRYLVVESGFPNVALRTLNADYPEELLQENGI